MSIRQAAGMILATHENFESPMDIRVSVSTAYLIETYMEVSDKSNVKLRLKKAHFPIKKFRLGMSAISYGDRTSAIELLNNDDSKFTVYSYEDFAVFLSEIAGDLYESAVCSEWRHSN